MTAIVNITAREILDSRGNPTVEVEVILVARALVRCQDDVEEAPVVHRAQATCASLRSGSRG